MTKGHEDELSQLAKEYLYQPHSGIKHLFETDIVNSLAPVVHTPEIPISETRREPSDVLKRYAAYERTIPPLPPVPETKRRGGIRGASRTRT